MKEIHILYRGTWEINLPDVIQKILKMISSSFIMESHVITELLQLCSLSHQIYYVSTQIPTENEIFSAIKENIK